LSQKYKNITHTGAIVKKESNIKRNKKNRNSF